MGALEMEGGTGGAARETLAAILACAGDAAAAASARSGKKWREGYVAHFLAAQRALLEANPEACRAAAVSGLDALYSATKWNGRQLADLSVSDARFQFTTERIVGIGERKPFVLPVPRTSAPEAAQAGADRAQHVRLLTDPQDILKEADVWISRGMCEADVRSSLERLLVDSPEWLNLRGQKFVCLGAGSEMGATRTLLSLGATVLAVELPGNKKAWDSLQAFARSSPGVLEVPVRDGRVGADVVEDLPEVATWICENSGQMDQRLVVGCFLYLDGANFVRVATAADALFQLVLHERPNSVLSTLCSPSEAFCVPEPAALQAAQRFKSRSMRDKVLGTVPGALMPNVPAKVGADSGMLLQDCYTPEQGPNYAFAKLLQRLRAIACGPTNAIATIAPASLTQSVMHNAMVRVGILGCETFGIVPFLPETSNALMTALLVHDVHELDSTSDRRQQAYREHPMLVFQHSAVHGGTWRCAYKTSSTTKISVVAFALNKLSSPQVTAAAALAAGAFATARL